MKKRIFVENEKKFTEKYEFDYLIKEKAKVKKYNDAIILPAIPAKSNSLNGTYAGGVCDSDFNFLAGLIRHDHEINLSCERSYTVPKEDIKYVDEEVIFGGVLFFHFGHLFLESLSRLWYVINNKSKSKIVFIKYKDLPSWSYDFFELLNISRDRIEIIEEPTKFKRVIVPDETIHAHYRYREEYISIFDEIRKNVTPKKYDKIYLTRTQLSDKNDTNEEYYEEFFRKRGYLILSPEKYSIREQVEYLSGAKEVVASIGTLSHMLLFCKNKTKLIMLNRVKNEVITPQAIITQARNLNYYIVDATLEVLPTQQARGCYLFYPTEYFKEYLDSTKTKYNVEELEIEKERAIYDYLISWTKNYTVKANYETIANKDAFDFINCLSKSLLNEPLKKRKYNTDKNGILSKGDWIKKYNEQVERNKEITNSKSWKLTKPLRKIIKRLKKVSR